MATRVVAVKDLKAYYLKKYKREATDRDIRYQTILASLLRVKRKTRVLPALNNAYFDYERVWQARLPPGWGERLQDSQPPPHPYPCASDCETCFTQFFPVLISVTNEEALSTLHTLTSRMNADMALLRHATRDNADFIVSRWKKKSVAKRTHLLSTLYPDVPSPFGRDHPAVKDGLYDKKWASIHLISDHSESYPTLQDSRALYPGTDSESLRTAAGDYMLKTWAELAYREEQKMTHQTTWFLPYLDVESLAEDPLLLLSLLHYRTSHETEEWMMFDNFNLKLSEQYIILINEFRNRSVVMTGENYGRQLVKSNPAMNHKWERVGYLKAQYILTAQHKMLDFLRRVVECILKELPATQSQSVEYAASPVQPPPMPSPKWDQLIRNKFSSFGSSEGGFIRACAVRPFSSPPRFDPYETQQLVESMYQASVDEIDLAQTDPAFLQHHIRKLKSAAFFKKVDSSERWFWFIDEILLNFFRRLIWWRQMRKECNFMVTAFERWQTNPTSANRVVYEDCVHSVHNIAIEHLTQQMLLVDCSLPFQRGFERNYEYESTLRTDGSKKMRVVTQTNTFASDPLFWSLKALGCDEELDFNMDPSLHFSIFQDRLSRGGEFERNRISEMLMHRVSEMAVIDDIRVTLECDRTWNREPDTAGMPLEFRTNFIKFYAQDLDIPTHLKRTDLVALFRVFYEKTSWPQSHIHDIKWLEKADAARKQLNKVWARFRSVLFSSQKQSGFLQEFIDQDQALFSAADRPEHLRQLEEERQAIMGRAKPDWNGLSERDPNVKMLSSLVAAPEDGSKFIPLPLRTKNKTRPEPSAEKAQAYHPRPRTSTGQSDTQQPHESASPRLRIPVKRDNISLLRAMFRFDNGSTRSFAWKHFLQAMADTGFAITQSAGSTVGFQNDKGYIVFHRPHPDPVIEPVVLYMMGKRMKRRFGWTAECFVEKSED